MHSAPRNLELLDDAMAQVLREKTVAQRLAIGNSLWIYARDLMQSVLRQEHPEWSDEEIQCQVARRMSHGGVNAVRVGTTDYTDHTDN